MIDSYLFLWNYTKLFFDFYFNFDFFFGITNTSFILYTLMYKPNDEFNNFKLHNAINIL